MEVYNINWTRFDLDILEKQGLQVTLQGLSFKLDYNLYYDALRLKGDKQLTATLGNAEIQLEITITQQQGRPSIVVTKNDLTIHDLDLGLSGALGVIAYVLGPVLREVLDLVIPRDVTPVLNLQLQLFTHNLTMQAALPHSDGLVLLDYSFVNDPIFASNEVTVSIKADIHASNATSCSRQPGSMPDAENRNVKIYVSDVVFSCLVSSYERSGALTSVVSSYITQEIPLASGMTFDVRFGESSLSVAPDGISFYNEIFIDVDRTVTDPEVFLTLASNITIQVALSMYSNGSGVYLYPYIRVAQLQGFHVVAFAADLPELYKQEILNSDWSLLTKKADAFLTANVIGPLNQQLAAGVQLPSIASKYLVQPELKLNSSYIFLGTDLAT
jgi:hypothetical protein